MRRTCASAAGGINSAARGEGIMRGRRGALRGVVCSAAGNKRSRDALHAHWTARAQGPPARRARRIAINAIHSQHSQECERGLGGDMYAPVPMRLELGRALHCSARTSMLSVLRAALSCAPRSRIQ